MKPGLNLLMTAALAGFGMSALNAQSLTDVYVPQYVQGATTTNNNRTPYFYRATLSGLTPSATYLYWNQVVNGADPATTNGSGNVIFANQAGAFFETSSPAYTTPGTTCSSFTTDGTGSYTGWFGTEPTGNARFTPGASVSFRVLLNNGAGGTTVVTRLTTNVTAAVINYGALATDGTAIQSVASPFTAKNFVLLFDNINGLGRPVIAAVVEADGWDIPLANTNYAAFYRTNVDEVATAWGTIIPNNLANGIQRIEERSLATGALVSVFTDVDGVWPSGANTVGTTGGLTPVALVNPTDYSFSAISDWTMLDDK